MGERRGQRIDIKNGQPAREGSAQPRLAEPRSIEPARDRLANGLPPEFEDAEGWMSERLDYWTETMAVPTKGAWLWNRLAQCAARVHEAAMGRLGADSERPPTEEDWRRLAAQAFDPGRCQSCGQRLPEMDSAVGDAAAGIGRARAGAQHG